jgi:hypothetical protein
MSLSILDIAWSRPMACFRSVQNIKGLGEVHEYREEFSSCQPQSFCVIQQVVFCLERRSVSSEAELRSGYPLEL